MPGSPIPDSPALSPWWQAYSADTTDADARSLAARKFDVLPESVELRRNGGCVLARMKETDEHK